MNGFKRTLFRGSPIRRVKNEWTFGDQMQIFKNDTRNLRITDMVDDRNNSLGITYMRVMRDEDHRHGAATQKV